MVEDRGYRNTSTPLLLGTTRRLKSSEPLPKLNRIEE